jgi:hypothetical protein
LRLDICLCQTAEKEHRRSERQYAHTFHYDGVICVCKAFWELPDRHLFGVLAHEIGHLLAGPHGSDNDADAAVHDAYWLKVRYTDTDRANPARSSLEYLSLSDMSKFVWLFRFDRPDDGEYNGLLESWSW